MNWEYRWPVICDDIVVVKKYRSECCNNMLVSYVNDKVFVYFTNPYKLALFFDVR